MGYAGESLGDGEFVMTYTFAMDSSGVLAAAAGGAGKIRRRRQKPRDARLPSSTGRLARALSRVAKKSLGAEAKLFCKTGTRESPF